MSKQNEDVVVNIQTAQPNWFNAAVSTLTQRISSSLFGVSKDGKRDINDIYGYKTTLSFKDFYDMWDRGGLASRIINVLPRSCWRDGIRVISDGNSILEDEIKILNRKGKMIQKLERADVLNRIGKFSILYVGVPDGLPADKPLSKAPANRLKEVYFSVYAEDGVTIVEYERDPTSPRYGLPLMYSLRAMTRSESDETIITKPITVHHSRVVHLAEGTLDNEIEGHPALRPIFNALEDLIKTSGGSSEAYFRNARNRFAIKTDPKYNANITAEVKEQMEAEAQAFQNEWRDFIRAGGFDIQQLSIPFNSPRDTFDVNMAVISGTTGIPVRILTGEGAGQLAGNEDKESYNQLVQDRKELYCSDWVFQVLEILETAGMINPLPADTEVEWPTPEVVSSKDKSANAQAKSAALSQLASALSSPALDGVVSVEDALKLVFGDDEISEIEIDESGDDGIEEDEILDIEPDLDEDIDSETEEVEDDDNDET